jgi:hypothetical protein
MSLRHTCTSALRTSSPSHMYSRSGVKVFIWGQGSTTWAQQYAGIPPVTHTPALRYCDQQGRRVAARWKRGLRQGVLSRARVRWAWQGSGGQWRDEAGALGVVPRWYGQWSSGSRWNWAGWVCQRGQRGEVAGSILGQRPGPGSKLQEL